MSNFTPGPWTANRQVNKHDESLGWIINGEGCRIGWSSYATAVPNEGEKAPHPIGEANARLIAAAPDLLEALVRLMKWVEPIAGDNRDRIAEAEELSSVELARAAIAKATGGTP